MCAWSSGGELRDGSSLVDAVAAAVGVRDHSTRPLREVLLAHLAVQKLLLVLDNCEQVVDAVAELARPLLRMCPRLRILATSNPIGRASSGADVRVGTLSHPVR